MARRTSEDNRVKSWKPTLGVSVKNRNEYSDYDYLDVLSEKDRLWLKKFHQEWLQSNFQHKKLLHKSKKQRKRCYDMNNARNRDLYSFKKVRHLLFNVEDI